MSDSFAYLEILFFAMLAAFIAFRLRGVLGRRTGHERRRAEPVARPQPAAGKDNVIPMPDRGAAPQPAEDRAIADVPDDGLKAALTEIRGRDPSFDLDGFLQGARAAFTMIVEAFGKGDRATLRPLIADGVFNEFARAIDDREGRGWAHTTELVNLRAAEVAAAALRDSAARVTVRFTSEQINVTRDADGTVVDGDPRRIAEVVDLWTFERDTRSRDPNWLLVETGLA